MSSDWMRFGPLLLRAPPPFAVARLPVEQTLVLFVPPSFRLSDAPMFSRAMSLRGGSLGFTSAPFSATRKAVADSLRADCGGSPLADRGGSRGDGDGTPEPDVSMRL